MDYDYSCALVCLIDTIPSFDLAFLLTKKPPLTPTCIGDCSYSKIVNDLEIHFDMTCKQKALFKCLQAPREQDFLIAIPIYRLSQYMPTVEYILSLSIAS